MTKNGLKETIGPSGLSAKMYSPAQDISLKNKFTIENNLRNSYQLHYLNDGNCIRVSMVIKKIGKILVRNNKKTTFFNSLLIVKSIYV